MLLLPVEPVGQFGSKVDMCEISRFDMFIQLVVT